MMPLTLYSNRTYLIGAFAVAAAIAGGVLIYGGLSSSLPRKASAATAPAGTVYLSPSASAAGASSGAAVKNPMHEITIANSGLVLLRGARVVSITGNTIRVELSWGSDSFAWDVHTRYTTLYFASTGAKETLSDIQPGDTVTVTGNLSADNFSNSVDADYVRE
jgi:hypothetical protein